MHTLEVVAELLLTLLVMRCASWVLGWALSRAGASRVTGALVANAGALAIFAGFLVWNLMPGEPFDVAAFVFGAAVYLACFQADLKWRPWSQRPAA